jgi:hypothetical protein
MLKHGLMNDLKKLDSFNKFVEQHSPKQSRQNSLYENEGAISQSNE